MDNPLIQALSPERLADYLTFFDHKAFTDNPDWAGCYCYFYLNNHQLNPWDTRTAQQNRTAVETLIACGEMYGYLAYWDGHPVGWCHAAPRLKIPNLLNNPELDTSEPELTGSILCFVVAPNYRHRGIARALLIHACQGFLQSGLSYAEGFPRQNATDCAANYHGPLKLYLDEGFTRYRSYASYQIVRKRLV